MADRGTSEEQEEKIDTVVTDQTFEASGVEIRDYFDGKAQSPLTLFVEEANVADDFNGFLATHYDRASKRKLGTLGCGAESHGAEQSRLRYQHESVTRDNVCNQQIQSRTCNNGKWSSWSGTYPALTCELAAPLPAPRP